MKKAKMRLFFVIVALLLFNTTWAQSRFFPSISKQPVWYVYAFNLFVCDGLDCYNYEQVYRFSIEPTDTQPTNGDNTYTLYSEVISANYDFSYTQRTIIGTITVAANNRVFYLFPDNQSNGYLDSRGILMYDDSISVGDSLDPGYWLRFMNNRIYEYPAMAITSTDYVTMGGVSRQRWKLGPKYIEDSVVGQMYYSMLNVPLDTTVQLFEGIGSNQGPIYFGSELSQLRQLVCYEELGDTIYRLIPGSPCDLALRDITGNAEIDVTHQVKIIPNPTSRYLNVLTLDGEWEYTIVNVLGQSVATGKVSPQQYQIDIDLANGTYIIDLKEAYGEGHTVKKIVVQN